MSKKQSEKEKRVNDYLVIRDMFIQQEYSEHIETISILKANIMALITAGPFFVFFFAIYIFIHDSIDFNFSGISGIIIWISIILSIPIHEFFHGFGWHLFCKNKWKSIRFGIMWSSLTPYCTCKEPLSFKSYLIGGLLPLTILGFLMSTIGIVFGSFSVFIIGALNILFAGGDTTIAFMLLKFRKGDYIILDHPTDCGFVAYKK